MSIPNHFIQDLLARADVTEVVGQHVQLKKAGANFLGLCPFHGEKSPSFTVSPAKQFYHCFGCGKNGNAIGFLMDHTGASFVEAIHDLAGRLGLVVPEDERSPLERERAALAKKAQSSLTSVLEKAIGIYVQGLRQNSRAVSYLKGRGLSGEIAKAFGLGYAAEGWQNLSQHYPHSDEVLLIEAGMMIEREADGETNNEKTRRYDRFRDRIMFPIRNVKGECIGFGGRVLDKGEPKYLNSPETPVFSKGRELYGLFEARNALREHGYALVTEGYMDVVALAQLGFPNAVATLGTACTPEHVQKLLRFTDAVVFSFDGDAAGRRAAKRALEAALPHASDTRSFKFLFLPAEHDPDSFIRANGSEAFRASVAQAVPLSRFLLDTVREGCDLDSIEGRSLLASRAKPMITALPQGALRLQLMQELGDMTELGAHNLERLWQDAAKQAISGNERHGHFRQESRKVDDSSSRSLDKALEKKFQKPFQKTFSKRPNRLAPASSADHAVRLLLNHSAAWDDLSAADHQMLAELESPYGDLFRWLEAQLHEHGAQPWVSLRAAMQDEVFAELAEQRMNPQSIHSVLEASKEDSSEGLADLHSALMEIRKDWLKREEQAALAASDLQRYRELQAQRLSLSSKVN